MTLRRLFLMAVCGLAGCSANPGKLPEAIDVNGTVTLADGKPVTNVQIEFTPSTSPGRPWNSRVDEAGKYTAKLTPGGYTFFFSKPDAKPAEKSKVEAAYKSIPEPYRTNSADHKVEVPASGGALDIKLQ
jgi:hypothetical protein